MPQKLAPLASTHSGAPLDDLVPDVLRTLIAVLRMCGLSGAQLRAGVDEAIADTEGISTADGPALLGGRQRECMEVMCAWRRDKEFLGSDGLPADLPVDGPRQSFERLCRRAAVKTSPSDLLRTLIDFGAVRQLSSGCVQAATPTFLLGEPKIRHLVASDGVLKQLAGFAKTIEFNTRQAFEGGRPRFERACTVVVAAELLPVFERIVRERGQTFIDVLDEWLERHGGEASTSGSYVEIGAGAYFLHLGNIEIK